MMRPKHDAAHAYDHRCWCAKCIRHEETAKQAAARGQKVARAKYLIGRLFNRASGRKYNDDRR